MKKISVTQNQINKIFNGWTNSLDFKTYNELAWIYENEFVGNFGEFLIRAISAGYLNYNTIPKMFKKNINFMTTACLNSKRLLSEIHLKDNDLHTKVLIEIGKIQNEIKIANKIV